MLKPYVEYVNSILNNYAEKQSPYFQTLYNAMAYSLKAGGKRIRPVLMQLCYEVVGGKETIEPYLCGIEMIHTYSLIHDDLPAMDNDDFRRGKPTNHKMFGEATAILAGDALLTEAFHIMLEDALKHDGKERLRAICHLAKASGVEGMIGGQILDIESEEKTIDQTTLEVIHTHKTGALIAAATEIGGILGKGSEKEIKLLKTYGSYIGKGFQIIDDVLDRTSTLEELGKPINSDFENHKTTYLSFYSVEECYQLTNELTQAAISLLDELKGDTTLLREIALQLIERRN